MSRNYSYRREQRPRRRGLGCLGWLVALVWIALLAVLGYRYFLRPQISQMIGGQLADQSSPVTSGDGSSQALPTVVAALPAGQIRVSDQQANEFLSSRSLGPIEDATVRFVPNEVQIDITALGQTSTASTGLAVQDGRIIAISPRIDGVLGQFISLDDLARTFEQQLNDQLAAQGRRVSDVRIEQGELIVNVEQN